MFNFGDNVVNEVIFDGSQVNEIYWKWGGSNLIWNLAPQEKVSYLKGLTYTSFRSNSYTSFGLKNTGSGTEISYAGEPCYLNGDNFISEATRLYMNTSCSGLFNYFTSLKSVPSFLDFSLVEQGYRCFRNCYALTEIPYDFNLFNLRSGEAFFEGCSSLNTMPENFIFNQLACGYKMFNNTKKYQN